MTSIGPYRLGDIVHIRGVDHPESISGGPKGEAYTAIESSKGELGYFVASDGTSDPLRCHIRAPGLMNVQMIPQLARGRLFSDLMAIIGSLDFVMGEVDR